MEEGLIKYLIKEVTPIASRVVMRIMMMENGEKLHVADGQFLERKNNKLYLVVDYEYTEVEIEEVVGMLMAITSYATAAYIKKSIC